MFRSDDGFLPRGWEHIGNIRVDGACRSWFGPGARLRPELHTRNRS